MGEKTNRLAAFFKVTVPGTPQNFARQGRKYSLPGGMVMGGEGGLLKSSKDHHHHHHLHHLNHHPHHHGRAMPSTTASVDSAPASPATPTPFKDHYRVVVMGCPKVGKTAIINQFLYDTFVPEYKATVEEMHRGEYCIAGNPFTLEILDTSGSNEFPAMRALSICNADAFILVYAIDNQASFEEVRNLREMIQTAKSGRGTIPTVVVGNKCDLEPHRRQVTAETAETVAVIDWEHGFVEASAKNNLNIVNIFKELLAQANIHFALSPAVRKRRQSLPNNSPIKLPNSLHSPKSPNPTHGSHKRNSCALS